jgi:hypothetical protein
MIKKKVFIYKNNIVLLDGSCIKIKSIKFFKNKQINYNFQIKKKKS